MDEQPIKDFRLQLAEKAYAETEKRRKELGEKIEKWQERLVDVKFGDISEDKKMYILDQLNTNIAKAENEKAQLSDQLTANLTVIGNEVCFLLFLPITDGGKNRFFDLF